MQNQMPISSKTVCELLDCAASAADLVLGDRSDWPLRDCAVQLLRELVEQEVYLFAPLEKPQGRVFALQTP